MTMTNVCRCHKISAETLRELAAQLLPEERDLQNLQKLSPAGTRCGQCIQQIEQILAVKLEEKKIGPQQSFSDWKLAQKISTIEGILEKEIRPLLKKDQGDVELFSIEKNIVYLKYLGACQSCPSSWDSTAIWIEKKLQEKLTVKDLVLGSIR